MTPASSIARRSRRLLAACAVAVSLAAPACDTDLSDLASFIDDDFGEISAEVTTLRQAEVEDVMNQLMLRFRFYLALRDAIPFSQLAPEDCLSDVTTSGTSFSFVADVNCTFGATVAPAEGAIAIRQDLVAEEPPVTELDVDYRGVTVGELSVHGAEHITETDATGGASVRVLDLVQDDVALDYRFRLGLLAEDVPVFDFPLSVDGEGLLARVTNPQTAGALATVFLIGVDGALECEVRDTAWTPEAAARGFCQNGLVFGLPTGPPPEAVTP